MDIIQENIDEVNAQLKVRVMENDYLPKIESVLKKHQKEAKIPGFRPGKIPMGMLKKKYYKSILLDEINRILVDSVEHYVKDNNIDVLGSPIPNRERNKDIDWDNQKDFEFVYDMALSPQFTVDISPSKKFTFQTIKFDDKYVDDYISKMAKQYGKVVDADVSEENDMLKGDFAELDNNGEIMQGGISSQSSIFIDKIKDAATKQSLIGLKKGDKVVLEANHLSENKTDLAQILGIDKEKAENITSKIQFTINSITRLAPAEMNQEFYDKMFGEGNVKSEEELKARVKTALEKAYKPESDRKLHNDVVTFLMDSINFNLPVDYMKRVIRASTDKSMTAEEVDAELANYSRGMKWNLIERKIIADNDIKVSAEEIIQYTQSLIHEQYHQMGYHLSEEGLKKVIEDTLKNEDDVKKLRGDLFDLKITQLFKSKFTLEEKEVDYNEFFDVKNKTNFAS